MIINGSGLKFCGSFLCKVKEILKLRPCYRNTHVPMEEVYTRLARVYFVWHINGTASKLAQRIRNPLYSFHFSFCHYKFKSFSLYVSIVIRILILGMRVTSANIHRIFQHN